MLVFSNESKFILVFDDGRVRVRQKWGDAILPPILACLSRRGSVSVIVWGGVTIYGVEQLVLVDGNNKNHQYDINILEENLLR